MSLPSFLLDKLSCPVTRQPLALVSVPIYEELRGSLSAAQRSDGWHPFPEQLLHTPDWERLYRVERGVPAMRPDQQLQLEPAQRTRLRAHSSTGSIAP